MGLFNFGGVSKDEFNKLLKYYDIMSNIALYNKLVLLYLNDEEAQKIITPEELTQKVFGRFSIFEIEDLKEFIKNVDEAAEETLNQMSREANARIMVDKMFPNG